MKLRIWYVLPSVLSFFLSVPLMSGVASADSEITEFRGGILSVRMSGSSSFLYGPGAYSAGMGGTFSGVVNRSAGVFSNPAGLGFLEKSNLTFDTNPGFMIDPARFYDIQGKIDEAVDDVVKDMSPEEKKGTVIEDMKKRGKLNYIDFSMKGGLSGGLHTGSIGLVLPGLVFGAGVYQPLNLNLSAVWTGFKTAIENTEVSDGDTTITTFLATTDANINMRTRVNLTTLALSREVVPDWTVGLSLDRYDMRLLVDAKFNNEGMISSTARGEEAFGDPTLGWLGPGKQNTLDALIRGDFEDTGWGVKIGTSYRLGRHLSFDGFLNFPPSLDLRGRLMVSHNTLDALNLEAEEGEDILDTSKLILSQLTRTKNATTTSDYLHINLPRSYNLGAAFHAGSFAFVLNYSQYSGELSFDYRCETKEAITPPPSAASRDDSVVVLHRAYSEGLRLKNGIRMGLDLRYLRFGGGVIFADEVSSGFKDKEGNPREPVTDLPLPFFSMAMTIPIGDNLRIGTVLVALPLMALRTSVDYSF
ncbi:MAG TPA: hypothetical protein EYP53_04595 [Candidatus Latescibacteria bacterium]|nr:hypothetical protein [Candidatus Latescibacterota bacterium]